MDLIFACNIVLNLELLQLSDDIKAIYIEVVTLDITEEFCQFFLSCFKKSHFFIFIFGSLRNHGKG